MFQNLNEFYFQKENVLSIFAINAIRLWNHLWNKIKCVIIVSTKWFLNTIQHNNMYNMEMCELCNTRTIPVGDQNYRIHRTFAKLLDISHDRSKTNSRQIYKTHWRDCEWKIIYVSPDKESRYAYNTKKKECTLIDIIKAYKNNSVEFELFIRSNTSMTVSTISEHCHNESDAIIGVKGLYYIEFVLRLWSTLSEIFMIITRFQWYFWPAFDENIPLCRRVEFVFHSFWCALGTIIIMIIVSLIAFRSPNTRYKDLSRVTP